MREFAHELKLGCLREHKALHNLRELCQLDIDQDDHQELLPQLETQQEFTLDLALHQDLVLDLLVHLEDMLYIKLKDSHNMCKIVIALEETPIQRFELHC